MAVSFVPARPGDARALSELRRRVWLRRLKYRLRLLAFPVLLMVSALAFFLAFLFPVGIYLLRAG